MNYTPLWIKTDYSILTSLIKIDDLLSTLSLNNITSVAICDDNLFGAMEFYNKCKKNGIKPIIGLEVKLDYTILLYAKNYHGYQNLCNINTIISDNNLNFDNLKKYLSDLVVVIPYEYKEKEEELKLYCEDLFIGYENEEEKEKLKENKVFINKTLTLNKDEIKYLPYLYKIKDENYDLKKDVSLKINRR